jgi:hypothetical protein
MSIDPNIRFSCAEEFEEDLPFLSRCLQECSPENVCGPRTGGVICSQQRGDCLGKCLMKKSLFFFGRMSKDLMNFALSAKWSTTLKHPEKDMSRFIKKFSKKVLQMKKTITTYESRHDLRVSKFGKKINKQLKALLRDGTRIKKSKKGLKKLSKRRLRKLNNEFGQCIAECSESADFSTQLETVQCNAKCAQRLINTF